MNKNCYVDTCIYLNLWQKEVEKKTGMKLWKLAQRFFEKIEEMFSMKNEDDQIGKNLIEKEDEENDV